MKRKYRLAAFAALVALPLGCNHGPDFEAPRDNVSSTDDELGRSAAFAGERLASAQVMSFQDVVYLKIAAGRITRP